MTDDTNPCAACGKDLDETESNHISLNPSIDTRTVKRGGCSTPRTTTTETYLDEDESIHLCDDHLHLAGEILSRDTTGGIICCGGELSGPAALCPSCGRSGVFIKHNGVECSDCGGTLIEDGASIIDGEWYCPSCETDADNP